MINIQLDNIIRKGKERGPFWLGGALVLLACLGVIFYLVVYHNKILPRVYVGTQPLGGLSFQQAKMILSQWDDSFKKEGVELIIGNNKEIILPEEVGTVFDISATLAQAWQVGRRGNFFQRLSDWLRAIGKETNVSPLVTINEGELYSAIEEIKTVYDRPRVDVRYSIKEDKVEILTDRKDGKVIDKSSAFLAIRRALLTLSSGPIVLDFKKDKPQVDLSTINQSRLMAEAIVRDELVLKYKDKQFVVGPAEIGEWIVSTYEGKRLVPGFDRTAISSYVVELADKINKVPQNLVVKVTDGKVVEFVPPRAGLVLEEDATVDLIIEALGERAEGKREIKEIVLPLVVKKPIVNETASELGIKELIGKATTSFAGSPPNRVANIKNGTKFLTGILISPGEEFSTVKALGRIDNTTGYLPELVIKGDRTVPEFGGGLCQVSTTLFRAVLNAGLPVTARRNHSYRVSYYETDGDGNYIGPGLDATIYSPQPDFRFLNDTTSTILIRGYVEGDKVTFELYGTKDGRRSEVDGPYTLSTIPPGDPIYAETDTLPPGEKKRLERAHPGGSAIATYKVYYPDGEVKEQVFKSYYRPWPERWLVGKVASSTSTSISVLDENNEQ